MNSDVFVQRVTPAGFIAPGWPANGVGACTEPHDQLAAALAADGVGGVILAWEDARDTFTDGWDIYAVRLTGTGTVAPGWPVNGVAVCRAPENQYYPQLAPDGGGGAIITWQDYRDGDSYNDFGGSIYAVRLDGSGQVGKGWTTGGTRLCTTAASEYWPRIVVDGAGGAIIAWNDDDIHAQRLTHDGQVAPGWPACGVTLCGARGRQEYAEICSDGASGAFAVWRDLRSYFPPGSVYPAYDLYGTHVMASGVIAAGWPVNGLALSDAPDGQFNASVTPDGAGGSVTAWEDYRSGEAKVYAVRVTGAGMLAPGWPVNGAPVSTAAGLQHGAALVGDQMGGAFIAFEEFDLVTSFSWVRAQHVTGSGQTAPGWDPAGVLVAGAQPSQSNATIAVSGLGAIVAWDDSRSDIYAQRFAGDGPVPVLVSLVEAHADPERAIMAWYVGAGAVLRAGVERRTTASDWASVATIFPDESGLLRFEDRGVSPGKHYGYRLRLSVEATEVVAGETWVDVPAVYVLTLDGAIPNPARGAFAVAFSLPNGAPASLELLDIGGRRVLERDVGSRGPGRHLIPLEETDAFPPGVYWMRLQQSDHVLTARAVKIR